MNRALLKREHFTRLFSKVACKKVFAQFSEHSVAVLSVQTILSADLFSERFMLCFLSKIRQFESFSKNLKYSIYPSYAAFLFLLNNFIRLEADVHIFFQTPQEAQVLDHSFNELLGLLHAALFKKRLQTDIFR